MHKYFKHYYIFVPFSFLVTRVDYRFDLDFSLFETRDNL